MSRVLPARLEVRILHVAAAATVQRNGHCVLYLLHFCTFLINPHFDLEPDYIVRKPIKRRFQRYLVRTEIVSTFHTGVEYISRQTIRHSAHSNQRDWVLTDTQTDTQTHKSENSISLTNIITILVSTASAQNMRRLIGPVHIRFIG